MSGIPAGATLMIGGFGGAGQPVELIDALIAQGAKNLTVVNNNASNGVVGLAALLAKEGCERLSSRFHDKWTPGCLTNCTELEKLNSN